MENKKNKKFSFKLKMLLIIILLLVIGTIIFFIIEHILKSNLKNETIMSTNQNAYRKVHINEKTYYEKLNENTWGGKYHKEYFDTRNSFEDIKEVVTYTKYLEIIKSINSTSSKKIKAYYLNENCNYIILSATDSSGVCTIDLIDCLMEDEKIIIYGHEDTGGSMASGMGYLIAIPTNLPIGTQVEYRECYTDSEIDNLKKYNNNTKTKMPLDIKVDKPIIYLYPEKTTEITVKLGKPERITSSYPKYENEWKVIANPDSTLKDLKTGRNLYSLYWEGRGETIPTNSNEGFLVKKEDTIKFLEEKLAILGLTEREAEEFIVYWLPKLEKNEYNYIRFSTLEEITEYMPLEINPKPDTIIRILMNFKGLQNPIEVKEQVLKTPERKGFTVVEWGGTEIK